MSVHAVARTLEGSGDPFDLPLCWDADQRQRNPDTADDDELWWLAIDHGAIDPDVHQSTPDRGRVTCADCLEWIHA